MIIPGIHLHNNTSIYINHLSEITTKSEKIIVLLNRRLFAFSVITFRQNYFTQKTLIMSRESVLKTKSFDFAVRVINLYKYLKKRHGEYIVSQQILRAGTSVGALIREAEFAESRKDFMHKLYIGLKEANESIYWLELLYATEYINKKMFESMHIDGSALLRMLVASVKTIKEKP